MTGWSHRFAQATPASRAGALRSSSRPLSSPPFQVMSTAVVSDTTACVRRTYDEVGEDWRAKVWATDPDFATTIRRFFGELGLGRHPLLDVGVGAGDYARILTDGSVVGVDISEGMLRACRAAHPAVCVVQADGLRLPFLDGSFSVVGCRNLLQNFDDAYPVLEELIRVLARGGRLAVVESAVYEQDVAVPTATARVAEPYHPIFPSHERLEALFHRAGLSEVRHEVTAVHRRWLAGWQRSKGASDEQRRRVFEMYSAVPAEYRQRYCMTLWPDEVEIESDLTFSLLSGRRT
jgi:SAM-dependent methyltransferase